MDSNCKEDETRLTEKLSELEQKMKQLQSSLMDEKFKLNRERLGEGDELPDNWASLSRLHLPQCPLAKATRTVGNRPPCALHGVPANQKLSNCSLALNYQTSDDPAYVDYHHYSKMISEAETLARADNINEKVRQLYESSIYSPTFYRPRDAINSHQPRGFEAALESQVIRFGSQEPPSDGLGLNTKQKKYDSFEEISLARNGSSSNTEAEADDTQGENCSKDATPTSEDGSSVDVFNPYGAIDSVRNKFLDIENYVYEASIKTKLKGAC